MKLAGERWGRAAWVSVVAAAFGPAPAGASEPDTPAWSVLVAPVQGSMSVGVARRAQLASFLTRALEARADTVVVANALLGRAVVACQSHECIEQTLEAADAELAIVPAIWIDERDGDTEVTLTLLRKARRNLNASATMVAELRDTAVALLEEVLAEHQLSMAPSRAAPESPASGSKHPHAWKAGPIILIAGGAGAFIAIGVGAATHDADQRLDTGAVAAWSAVGAAALGGGAAWWVVGAKRRRGPALALRPTRIDFRLRF